MLLSSKMLAVLLGAAVLAAPAVGQVVTPPQAKPKPAEPYIPPPPPDRPRLAERPADRSKIPDTSYVPITRRDNDGKIIPLDGPVEYVAMSHNPMIDVDVLSKIAPLFYLRRQRIEAIVVNNLDAMIEIENGIVETMRLGDPDAMRVATAKVTVFTQHASVDAFLTDEITKSGIINRQVGIVTKRVMKAYQDDLTNEAMNAKINDEGSTGLDQMMQLVLRMSISEFEYFYDRLMMDAAYHFGTVMPELGLDADTTARVAPIAERLESEGDLDILASLIREALSELDDETRHKAITLTIERRPEIDPYALMAPMPEDAVAIKLDDETRLEIIFQLLDGGRVDINAFLE